MTHSSITSSVAGIIANISIRIPTLSFGSLGGLGIKASTGIGIAVGLSAKIEHLMGFPTVTANASHEINNAAMSLAVANVVVNTSEKPIGHHSIPIYMCGSEKGQQLVPLRPSAHIPLHSAMVAYSAAINTAYKHAFTGANKIFSYSNKEPLQLLAQTPQGRTVITKHLRLFYNFGWFKLGAPYFEGIFESESIKYIGGFTSLPACKRL